MVQTESNLFTGRLVCDDHRVQTGSSSEHDSVVFKLRKIQLRGDSTPPPFSMRFRSYLEKLSS